jgi:PPOX class probable F420-dependent enzyme
MGAFDRLASERTVVVTTYKKDGSPVATPVNVAVLGDHAYFRTWSTSGKAKRLRRDPRVQIAPSTMRGRPTGPAIDATARLLGIDEEETVKRALSKKHRIVHGWLVPLTHRVRHYDTVYYELSVPS